MSKSENGDGARSGVLLLRLADLTDHAGGAGLPLNK